MAKLTDNMRKALEHLSGAADGASAYGMRVSLSTMYALEKRKMVRQASQSGWLYSPQTCAWKITKLGREAILEQEHAAN